MHFDFDAVEKHPIDAFSCNVKTARPRLKTDTIASIEKKSLLSTGKYTYKARVLEEEEEVYSRFQKAVRPMRIQYLQYNDNDSARHNIIVQPNNDIIK